MQVRKVLRNTLRKSFAPRKTYETREKISSDRGKTRQK